MAQYEPVAQYEENAPTIVPNMARAIYSYLVLTDWSRVWASGDALSLVMLYQVAGLHVPKNVEWIAYVKSAEGKVVYQP